MNKYILSSLILIITGCALGIRGPDQTCTVAENSAGTASIVSCPDGSGTVIPNGTDGSNGLNGSTVTPVQLCPGVTAYPSTFCEVAFCINGNLWGTYSANDGFSSELPQGTYSSDGINCSCTVEIGADCSVSS